MHCCVKKPLFQTYMHELYEVFEITILTCRATTVKFIFREFQSYILIQFGNFVFFSCFDVKWKILPETKDKFNLNMDVLFVTFYYDGNLVH